jgi:hypothetical protein
VSSAKVAVAAGVKPAALITRQGTAPKLTATSALTSKQPARVAAKKTAKKARHKAVAKAKAKPTPAQNQSVAKSNPSPIHPLSNAPAPAASGKTASPAPPANGTVAVKPGGKPSPAIAKGEHP